MTLEELKSYLPGWVKFKPSSPGEYTIYYLTGDVQVGKYGPDPWVSAEQELQVSFAGDRIGESKFKFITERLATKTTAIIVHEDDIDSRLSKFTPDTEFGKFVIHDIFNNSGKYRD